MQSFCACADNQSQPLQTFSLPHWSCDPGVITAGQVPTQSFQSPPGLPSLASTILHATQNEACGPAQLSHLPSSSPRVPVHPRALQKRTPPLLVDDTLTPGARADGKGQRQNLRNRRQAGSDSCPGEQRLHVVLLLEELRQHGDQGGQESYFSERGARSRKQTHRKHSPELTAQAA